MYQGIQLNKIFFNAWQDPVANITKDFPFNWTETTRIGRELFDNIMKLFSGELNTPWAQFDKFINLGESLTQLTDVVNHRMSEQDIEE